MSELGNYSSQIGQVPYTPRPAFQQRPAAALPPPPPPFHGPSVLQPQVIQQGDVSFQRNHRIPSYQHAAPSIPYQHLRAPVRSSVINSSQSYLPHSQLPQSHPHTGISQSNPSSRPQQLPWGHNVSQFPDAAHRPSPNAYPVPSSQWYTPEGHKLNQPLRHTSCTPMPPDSSSYRYGSSMPFMPQHSNLQSMKYIPPVPRPSSTPLVLSPLVPSDIQLKNEGNHSVKDVIALGVEHQTCLNPAEAKNLRQTETPAQTEKNGQKLEPVNAIGSCSPADSDMDMDMDMDMEDDITLPNVEKSNLSNELDSCVSLSRGGDEDMKLQDFQLAQGLRSPEVALREDILIGSEVTPDYDFYTPRKLSSEDEDRSMNISRQTEEGSLAYHVKEPSFQSHNISKPTVPVLEESDYAFDDSLEMKGEKLLGDDIHHPSMDDITTNSNANKLCKVGMEVPVHEESGYAFDDSLDMKDEKLLGDDIHHPSMDDVAKNTQTNKQLKVGLEVQFGNPSDSNIHKLPISCTQSTQSSEEDYKLSRSTEKRQEVSCQESIGVVAALDVQPKSSSGNHDDNIVVEGPHFRNPHIKSDHAKLNVDEFGRLVREGFIDSDTSDSPDSDLTRRDRKRNTSRSRSARRSSWRRKERRKRSRSSSPWRHKSRSRSPVSRHDYKFEHRRRILDCFNFRQGRCYRGASCRFSHHKSEQSAKLRYNTPQLKYRGSPRTSRSPHSHKTKVLPEKEVKDEQPTPSHDFPGFSEAKVSKQLTNVELSSEKLVNMESGHLPAVADVEQSKLSANHAHAMSTGKRHTSIPDSHAQDSNHIPQLAAHHGESTSSAHNPVDKPDGYHGPNSQLAASMTPMTNQYSTKEFPVQSLKESPIYAMPTCPPPSVSQVNITQFAKPVAQVHSSIPPFSHFSSNHENHSPYQTPLAYQQSHFPGTLSSLSSSFASPSQPPNNHLPVRVSGEHSGVSKDNQQFFAATADGLSSYASMKHQTPELPSGSWNNFKDYSPAHNPDSFVHASNGFGSSSNHVNSLLGPQGGANEHPVQRPNPVPSFFQARPYRSFMQSPMNRYYSSLGEGPPSGGNSSYSNPFLHHTAHGMQYSSTVVVTSQVSQPCNVSHPDVQDSMGSRIPYHFNPYTSAFDLPQKSKFSSNTLIQETDITVDAKFGASDGLSSLRDVVSKFPGKGPRSMISSSELPVVTVPQRPCGDQYDPLFDSIEPASTSLNRVDQTKLEAIDDSDNMVGFRGSRRLSDVEAIKREGGTALSINISPGNEEYGETDDIDVEAFSNASLCNPNNDSTGLNGGDIEIDQVKYSGESKSKDSRSMKLFKSSIATFVKEVLKPSWRQGNMSKEAFKTIVKKTVDKVSGAMRSKKVPKSKANIDRYINTSRGKLTRLVMGYVDKYVNT